MIGLVLFVWALVNYFFRGYVFMMIWNWFPHTIFNAPEIGFAGSLGLLLIILFFNKFKPLSQKEISKYNFEVDSDERLANAFTVTLYHGAILLSGWIITFFI